MHAMEPMTLADIETAPFRAVASATLDAPPETVFAQLAEPACWLDWFPLMRRAAWTSSTTAAVGAERSVALRVFGKFDERFLAWEPGKRYTFTMTASTSPLVSRMAEDWRLSREAGGTRLEWTVAAVPTTLGRAGTPMLRMVLRRMFRRSATNLGRLLSHRGTQVA